LNITDICEADAGHYACHLSTSGGSTTTSCEISMEKVQGYMQSASRLQTKSSMGEQKIQEPELTIKSLPSTLDIQAGRVLSLSTSFTGSPTSVIWSLNGSELADGAEGGRISIETTSSSSTITVLSVQDADAGTYKLKIESATACEFSTAKVNVTA